MSEEKLDIIYELQSKLTESAIDFSNNLEADKDHGSGFETKDEREDFVNFFDEKFNKLTEQYNQFKQLLN